MDLMMEDDVNGQIDSQKHQWVFERDVLDQFIDRFADRLEDDLDLPGEAGG